VKRAARWYRLQSLPQEFEIPKDYVLPSEEFHREMLGALRRRPRMTSSTFDTITPAP
jgi:hypothetical protein